MLYSERGLNLIIAAILLAAIGKLTVFGLGKQGLIPVNAFGKFLHFRRRHAGRVHDANDAAHAGSGHAVDRDVILFQPLNHTNLRQPEGTTAAERQADSGTLRWHRCGKLLALVLDWKRILCRCQCADEDQQEPEDDAPWLTSGGVVERRHYSSSEKATGGERLRKFTVAGLMVECSL